MALAFAVTLVGGCGGSGTGPLNVVLVSIDTLAPRRMSTYGASRPTTPSIDALARRGVRFTNAFSPSPWTLPGHAAMLSGRYPSSLSPDPNDSRLYQAAPLLATLFRRAGYRTAAHTDGGFLSHSFGVDRDFERFADGEDITPAERETLAAAGELVKAGKVDEAKRLTAPLAQRRDLTTWVEEQLRAFGAAPFFLFLHTYVVHVPYLDRRYVETLDAGGLPAGSEWSGAWCPHEAYSNEEKEFIRALYDGGVAKADEMVGKVIDRLERNHLMERTIVIVTSDHGEEFWEHTDRGAYHGHTLYDEVLRVPLVWYAPDLPNPGRSIDEMVSLIDIAPTLAARLGLVSPPAYDGIDLAPVLRGGSLASSRDLFGEGVRHGPARFSIRSREGTLIETPNPRRQDGEGVECPIVVANRLEVYAPTTSPTDPESHPTSDPALEAALADRLARHRRSAATTFPRVDRPTVDGDTRDRLRALGYVQ